MKDRQPHVVVIGNQADTMIRFRGSLLASLIARGAHVTAVCPSGTQAEQQALGVLGVDHVPIRQMGRSSLSPIKNFKLILELIRILRDLAPTHVLSYFLKPSIYGSIAAGLTGVSRRIAMIEGLGFAFSESPDDGVGSRARRTVARVAVTWLLRRSLRGAHAVIVLNVDDAAFLEKTCGVSPAKIRQIDGIGVDMDEFAQAAFTDGPTTFCLAARLIREKGVIEFVEAARRIKIVAPETRFILLGNVDDSPHSISRSELEEWVASKLVRWPGKVADVRPWYAESTVFVLPSYYGEGLPRSIMEAMSMGRAVVTTSVPGCSDSVTTGVSGFIVPPRDVDALSSTLQRFIANPILARTMGDAAAVEARRRYDRRERDATVAGIILGPGCEP